MMARVWIDLVTPSDVHVMASVLRGLADLSFTVTARDRAETVGLARSYGLSYIPVGKDDPRRVMKVLRYGLRAFQLRRILTDWDISLSFNNMNSILLSLLSGRPSITMMDNDLELVARNWSLAKRGEIAVNLRASRIICPSAFPIARFLDLGVDREAILPFEGFKEDLYVADFQPDSAFKKQIPFDKYVVLRPEALDAVYVRSCRSIIPEIVGRFANDNVNIVYLPRTAQDVALLGSRQSNVYVPPEPLNGLQLAWYSLATLTGSGSFAREAACLGVPALSFFPGGLLAVDRTMVQNGWIVHTRDVETISEFVLSVGGSRRPLTDRSNRVRSKVIAMIRKLVEDLTS